MEYEPKGKERNKDMEGKATIIIRRGTDELRLQLSGTGSFFLLS